MRFLHYRLVLGGPSASKCYFILSIFIDGNSNTISVGLFGAAWSERRDLLFRSRPEASPNSEKQMASKIAVLPERVSPLTKNKVLAPRAEKSMDSVDA